MEGCVGAGSVFRPVAWEIQQQAFPGVSCPGFTELSCPTDQIVMHAARYAKNRHARFVVWMVVSVLEELMDAGNVTGEAAVEDDDSRATSATYSWLLL